MVESEQNKHRRAAAPAAATGGNEQLPFSVELWRSEEDIERVLGLASSAVLARAIFRAAIIENPGRRITLRQGRHIVEDSR
jgi:hypothetical protein